MIATETSVGNIVNYFNQLNQQTKNKGLAKLRSHAIKSFEREGFPAKKNEEYRYINLDEVKHAQFKLPSSTILENAAIEELKIPNLKATTLVFVDGIYSPQHSVILDENIEIKTLEEAPEEIFSTEDYISDQYNPFAHLNIAFATNGVYIHVAKSQIVEHPIQIIGVNTGQKFVQPHHVLVAEENSQVKIIENYFSLSDEGIDNTFFKIIAKPSSIVEHYKLQLVGENASHFGTTYVEQQSKSVCTTHVYNLGGGLVRNNIHVDIEDERTDGHMYGLYVLDDKDVADNHTLFNHKKSSCVSNQLYKGILTGESKGVFNGKIFVQRNAQDTNAFQSNNNIVLSDYASINTKPQLEIWADDVRCSHGATIGKLNADEIFYLKARGIKEEKAKAMLTFAFAGEVLTHITIPELRAFLEEGVAQKLGFEL